jgi:predicted homoserine dehydrogenase-like protein
MVDNIGAAREDNALAMGLTDGAVMKRDVAADTVITVDDVDLPQGRVVDRLREAQAQHFGA